MINPRHTFTRTIAALALAGALAVPTAAQAATATATVTGGSLSFLNSTPGDVTFPGATLNGANRTVTQTQAFDVGDATGSGAGWNITATSTTFSDGGTGTLPTTAVTVASQPGVACDASVTCTTATPTSITYPYTLPAAGSAPTATKLFNAATSTGMGAQTVTPTWTLTIPASAKAGTYTSTWTFSLVSAP